MDWRGTLARARTRLRPAVARRLGVDARALAALRVALGLVVLADLAIRATDLAVFYTDAGVLPRAALAARYPTVATLSLHAQFGSLAAQVLLFFVAGVAALSLAAGYRTRLSTAVSVLLLASLHARNPVLLNAGDSLLRRTLFWGLFLPLGARWSVDALDRDDGATWVATLATAALLVQVVIVYAVNAVVKLAGDSWTSGTAVRYVFSLDQLTVLLGNHLTAYPELLVAADYGWLALVCASPLLLVLTGWRRTALVGLFAGAHLGMLLTMRLGLFPLISIAALLPFLPPAAWDRLSERLAPLVARIDRAPWRDRLAGLPRGPSLPAVLRRGVGRVAPVLVAVLLVAVLVWNAAGVGLVSLSVGERSAVDPAEHRWDMFAPAPPRHDGWYVVPGRLASGERVDALHREPVSWERPREVARAYPSHRWYLYLLDLRRPAYAGLRPAFADYLCARWNGTHADDLRSLTVYYVEQESRLEGPEPVHRVRLGQFDCSTG
jgi:hypothetical protein